MQTSPAADFQPSGDELTLEILCAALVDERSARRTPAPLSAGASRQPPAASTGGCQLWRGDSAAAPFDFASLYGRNSMNSPCYTVAMDLGVCQLRNFSISFLSSLLGTESSSVRLDKSSSGASVVAIDNKIEQAMDLVKSHLMYAVREEVEVLKEQIKELIERNSQLEQENNLLKTLASPEQLAQFQAQVQSGSPMAQGSQQPAPPAQLASQNSSGPSA
ncbi:TSC22 domain family protein 1 isoform X2 [Denticeps clupeoides]|nr:TSC22 domain family protein 1 isoform X2 [Denticeps clupeoides]